MRWRGTPITANEGEIQASTQATMNSLEGELMKLEPGQVQECENRGKQHLTGNEARLGSHVGQLLASRAPGAALKYTSFPRSDVSASQQLIAPGQAQTSH